MALLFGAATTDRVNHGSNAVLDNIGRAAAGMTVWLWLRRTSDGNNQHIITKDGAGVTGFNLSVTNTGGEGSPRFIVWHDVTHADYRAVPALPLDTDVFLAATFLASAAQDISIYAGSLTATVAELSYNATQNAAGTAKEDATIDLYVGNLPRSTTLPFKGRISRVGIVNRALTLGELRTIQFASLRQCNISGTILLCDYHGTGTQPDLSGEVNNGTVTGASIANHVPLKQPYPSEEWLPYVVAAGGASKVPVFMNDYRRRRVN